MNLHLTRAFWAKVLLAAFLAAGGLFACLTPATRDYTWLSFSSGDAAYAFYDDFPVQSVKSDWIFKCLGILALGWIHRFHPKTRNTGFSLWIPGLFLAGGAALVISWSTALMVFLVLFALVYPWNEERTANEQSRIILAGLVFIALILRLEKLPNVWSQPLQPDVIQYVQLSQQMTWFYDTGHREPFLAWINYLLSFLIPVPSQAAQTGYWPIRVFTVAASGAVVGMMYILGRQFFSHRVAFLGALMAALNKALIYRSLQGLRLEILTVAILAVLWLALRKPEKPGNAFRQGTALGIAAGILLLIRTASIPFLALVFGWAWIAKKRTLRECAIAAGVGFVLASPYYFYCWQQYGDPMYSGSYHINKFYYMTVFGTGAPDTSQVPFVTAGEVMFQIYPWYKSLALTVEGILDTLFGRFALRLFYLPFSVALIGCSLVGYIRWVKNPENWGFLLSVGLLLGPMAFVLAMLNHSPVTFDWRTVAHLFPFMAYATGEGLFYLTDMVWGKRGENFHNCEDREALPK
ncbi:MAG: hypothetical protein ACE15F_13905 [bacterium]